jgi:hypothetical protein
MTDCRRLLQQLVFSKSRHVSWDMFPANIMAYGTPAPNLSQNHGGAMALPAVCTTSASRPFAALRLPAHPSLVAPPPLVPICPG